MMQWRKRGSKYAYTEEWGNFLLLLSTNVDDDMKRREAMKMLHYVWEWIHGGGEKMYEQHLRVYDAEYFLAMGCCYERFHKAWHNFFKTLLF